MRKFKENKNVYYLIWEDVRYPIEMIENTWNISGTLCRLSGHRHWRSAKTQRKTKASFDLKISGRYPIEMLKRQRISPEPYAG